MYADKKEQWENEVLKQKIEAKGYNNGAGNR